MPFSIWISRIIDWHVLTGGLLPSIKKDNTVFNNFVALFPFGWALFAIGNSILPNQLSKNRN